jgi:putative hemolysin
VAFAGFIALPSMRLTQRSAQFAAFITPVIAWILAHSHNLLDRIVLLATRFREVPLHSRLYEKEDLLDLVHRQQDQSDNRIHQKDLDLVKRALTFDDTKAADIVQPRKQAHLVNADDSIGPVLLDQLHKQKRGSFLVYKDEKENIIGSLALSDAVTAKHGGRVFDLIRNDLIFVHEDFTARQVLDAFHKTGHHVAVVINNAEEFVGVITLDHLLQSLLGEAKDEGIAYGDKRAVAAYKPKPPEQTDSDSTDTTDETDSPASSPEATEVVE